MSPPFVNFQYVPHKTESGGGVASGQHHHGLILFQQKGLDHLNLTQPPQIPDVTYEYNCYRKVSSYTPSEIEYDCTPISPLQSSYFNQQVVPSVDSTTRVTGSIPLGNYIFKRDPINGHLILKQNHEQ